MTATNMCLNFGGFRYSPPAGGAIIKDQMKVLLWLLLWSSWGIIIKELKGYLKRLLVLMGLLLWS